MPPVVSVKCSHTPPRITSTFHVDFEDSAGVSINFSNALRATRIKRGASEEEPLPGSVTAVVKPLWRAIADMQLTFVPSRTEKALLNVGDVVCIALSVDQFDKDGRSVAGADSS